MTEKLKEMGSPLIHSRDSAASGGMPDSSTRRQERASSPCLGNQGLTWTLRQVVLAWEVAQEDLWLLSKELAEVSVKITSGREQRLFPDHIGRKGEGYWLVSWQPSGSKWVKADTENGPVKRPKECKVLGSLNCFHSPSSHKSPVTLQKFVVKVTWGNASGVYWGVMRCWNLSWAIPASAHLHLPDTCLLSSPLIWTYFLVMVYWLFILFLSKLSPSPAPNR